jgi:phosphatidylserine/phosphatidylglycerophosphate/cardiolipin synthase-like enzyme
VLEPGVNCWRIERASRASVIVDADDYFRIARAAMLKARQRIMLIGWDFDARIDLDRRTASHEGPTEIGEFIYWLVERNTQLEVYLLRWDLGALKAVFRGTTILTVVKWMRHPRIHVKLDSAHPPTASHHQKIVVLDDSFAFCGGIDMTGDRWDTRAHRDDDPLRRQPNGEAYDPWHDATTALDGVAARALGELARERWQRAGGSPLAAVSAATDCWPVELPVQFRDVDVAIARSAPEFDHRSAVVEIERLYLDLIASAQRFIYIENQYFASRLIAIALAKRLAEEHGPEIVVVNPCEAKGWLEPLAMDTTRARLYEALRRCDRHGRFRIYHPITQRGASVYVHAKIMIVDDFALRVGSSNLNSRSMRLDTECDVLIATTLVANAACGAAIRAVRDGLLAEHLGVAVTAVSAKIDEVGSLVAGIEALRGGPKTLQLYQTPDLSAVEEWLADNDVLNPGGPEEPFEALARRPLFRRWTPFALGKPAGRG